MAPLFKLVLYTAILAGLAQGTPFPQWDPLRPASAVNNDDTSATPLKSSATSPTRSKTVDDAPINFTPLPHISIPSQRFIAGMQTDSLSPLCCTSTAECGCPVTPSIPRQARGDYKKKEKTIGLAAAAGLLEMLAVNAILAFCMVSTQK